MKDFNLLAERRLILVAAVVVGCWAEASLATEIAMRSKATPLSTVVRLGDVADVRGKDTANAKRLALLPLMPAPAKGTRRFLRMREVQDLLAAHGEAMDQLDFHGATLVEVTSATLVDPSIDAANMNERERRRAAWLGTSETSSTTPAEVLSSPSLDGLRQELSQLIVDHLNQRSGVDAEWQVELDVSSRYLELLPQALSQATCDGGQAPWVGRQRFIIEFPTAQGPAKFAVTANVTRPQPVVVAIRPIERGAVVTAAHVRIEQRDDLALPSGRRTACDTIESVVGMEATRPIQEGQIVFTDEVRAPLLVKRGDNVTVFARGGGIQVRTMAKARQDGARGELVQVEAVGTRDKYDAIVTGQRELVIFAGNTVPTPDVAENTFLRKRPTPELADNVFLRNRR